MKFNEASNTHLYTKYIPDGTNNIAEWHNDEKIFKDFSRG